MFRDVDGPAASRWMLLWAIAAVGLAGSGPTAVHNNLVDVESAADSAPPAATSQAPGDVAASEAAPFYTVAEYGPERDAAKDLADTIRRARDAKKRILLQIGGEWCGWCHKLDAYIAEHGAVSSVINDNFVIMKVNFSEDNKNEAFLAQYPEIPGYPHLYVLESDGTLLHSQNTVELEEGSSYSGAAILAFLDRWKAS